MGILGKIITGKLADNAMSRVVARQEAKQAAHNAAVASAARTGQYIPANQAAMGGTMLDKATRFYQQNPKLVATAATAVAAMVLSRLTQKRIH